jgi:hypothetical protein
MSTARSTRTTTDAQLTVTLTSQGDGKIVAGGAFTIVQPNSSTTAVTRNAIARFNFDGTLIEF